MTVWAGVLGMCIGSFLGLVAHRAPRGQSIVRPASHCTQCGHRLAANDLLPVVSFCLLRGRCRYCGVKLPVIDPLAELATGGLFAASFFVFYGGGAYPLGSTVVAMLLCSMAVLCTLVDLQHMLVLDVSLLVCAVPGLALNLLRQGLCRPADALLGIVAGALPLLAVGGVAWLLTRKWAMGGGDIKFMAAVGALLGWQNALLTLLFGSLGGGLVLLPLLAAGKVKRGQELPFVPMLAGGAVLALFLGRPLLLWYLSQF